MHHLPQDWRAFSFVLPSTNKSRLSSAHNQCERPSHTNKKTVAVASLVIVVVVVRTSSSCLLNNEGGALTGTPTGTIICAVRLGSAHLSLSLTSFD